MLKNIASLLIICILFGCSKNDDKLRKNPFLTNPLVSLNLNLNLPEYNPLRFPGNYVIVPQGIKGIVVYCTSESQYEAFDLTDPNHVPSNCSQMEIDGIIASCPCPNDDNSYYIITGLHLTDPNTMYPMQRYRAVRNGNNISITN